MIIGPHIHKGSDLMPEAINKVVLYGKERANIDVTAVGLFIMEPNGYKLTVSEDEIIALNKITVSMYVHNSYLAHPWILDRKCSDSKRESDSLDDLKKSKTGIHFINKQLEVCDRINAKGFVIHLPRNNIEMVINVLKKLYNPELSTRIFLEIPAICPKNSIFHKPSVLNSLFKRIRDEIDPTLSHFGLCIDTAHLWSCGVDISEYRSAEDWLNELDIDSNCLMIHCNDNDRDLGFAPDIHSPLTKGKIWSSTTLRDSGLHAFILYAKKNNVPVILERRDYKMLLNDYNIIQELT